MKKIVVYSWIVYLMALFLMPCADMENHITVDGMAKTQTTQLTNAENRDQHDDVCSPFCYCGCCAITLSATNLTPLTLTVIRPVISTNTIVERAYPIISNFNHSIWQPPKLIA